jgi:uncharacterized protein (DUF433 family)
MKVDELLESDSEKAGGAAVFAGTQVPVEALFQFLADDQTLETFLDHFPTVSRAQAQGVLGVSRELLLGAASDPSLETSGDLLVSSKTP